MSILLTDLHVSNKYKKLASSAWNQLQSQLKVKDLVSISECKMIFSDLDAVTSRCKCFALIASKQAIYLYISLSEQLPATQSTVHLTCKKWYTE